MDAVTAFLQGDLQESIFMNQPEGYDDGSGRVCQLNKAIYGLKQAGRTWNQKLDKILLKFGLVKSKCDPCVYFNRELNLTVAIYVDDFLIFYKENENLNKLKSHLNESLHMKDVGEARKCIDIQITKAEGKIELSQQTYVEKIDIFHIETIDIYYLHNIACLRPLWNTMQSAIVRAINRRAINQFVFD